MGEIFYLAHIFFTVRHANKKLGSVEGLDLIDCSSGGSASNATIPVGAGYQVPISETVRRRAEIATVAEGLITSAAQVDEILCHGQTDIVVLLGREMLRNPYWALQAAQTLKQPAPIPIQYLHAF